MVQFFSGINDFFSCGGLLGILVMVQFDAEKYEDKLGGGLLGILVMVQYQSRS